MVLLVISLLLVYIIGVYEMLVQIRKNGVIVKHCYSKAIAITWIIINAGCSLYKVGEMYKTINGDCYTIG